MGEGRVWVGGGRGGPIGHSFCNVVSSFKLFLIGFFVGYRLSVIDIVYNICAVI